MRDWLFRGETFGTPTHLIFHQKHHQYDHSILLVDGPEVSVMKTFVHNQGSVSLHLICQVYTNGMYVYS